MPRTHAKGRKRITLTVPNFKGTLYTRCVGTSELIYQHFSEEALAIFEASMTADKTTKAARPERTEEYKEAEAIRCLNYAGPKPRSFNRAELQRAKLCIPAVAIRKGMIAMYHKQAGLIKKFLETAIFVRADAPGNRIFLEWSGDPWIGSDFVKPRPNKPDIRYRPYIPTGWAFDLVIDFDTRVISPKQIGLLLSDAGFCNGIGGWRVSLNGQNGQFEPHGYGFDLPEEYKDRHNMNTGEGADEQEGNEIRGKSNGAALQAVGAANGSRGRGNQRRGRSADKVRHRKTKRAQQSR